MPRIAFPSRQKISVTLVTGLCIALIVFIKRNTNGSPLEFPSEAENVELRIAFTEDMAPGGLRFVESEWRTVSTDRVRTVFEKSNNAGVALAAGAVPFCANGIFIRIYLPDGSVQNVSFLFRGTRRCWVVAYGIGDERSLVCELGAKGGVLMNALEELCVEESLNTGWLFATPK